MACFCKVIAFFRFFSRLGKGGQQLAVYALQLDRIHGVWRDAFALRQIFFAVAAGEFKPSRVAVGVLKQRNEFALFGSLHSETLFRAVFREIRAGAFAIDAAQARKLCADYRLRIRVRNGLLVTSQFAPNREREALRDDTKTFQVP